MIGQPSSLGKRYRVFGYVFVTVMVALTLSHAKPYYSAPAFPLMLALVTRSE